MAHAPNDPNAGGEPRQSDGIPVPSDTALKTAPDPAGTPPRPYPCALTLAAVRQPTAMPAHEPAREIEQLEHPLAASGTREVEPDAAKVRPMRHEPDRLHRRTSPIVIGPAVADPYRLALAYQGGRRAISPLHAHVPSWRRHLLSPKLPAIFGDGVLSLSRRGISLREMTFPISRA